MRQGTLLGGRERAAGRVITGTVMGNKWDQKKTTLKQAILRLEGSVCLGDGAISVPAVGSHGIASGLPGISARFASGLKWGSCHRALGIQLCCRKAEWADWEAELSPCPQMRCGKRQGRARRCCRFCMRAVQALPLQRKVESFLLTQRLPEIWSSLSPWEQC